QDGGADRNLGNLAREVSGRQTLCQKVKQRIPARTGFGGDSQSSDSSSHQIDSAPPRQRAADVVPCHGGVGRGFGLLIRLGYRAGFAR
ncbi:MAG: hypothetical protein ACO3BE_07505, partial [Gemmobacter sp.]